MRGKETRMSDVCILNLKIICCYSVIYKLKILYLLNCAKIRYLIKELIQKLNEMCLFLNRTTCDFLKKKEITKT